MKRSPIKRKTPLRSGYGAKRGRQTAKTYQDFSHETRRFIERRSRGLCEAGTRYCTHKAAHVHHRLRRSQGGAGSVENGLYVCSPCHTWIHDHPAESYERGWLLRSGQEVEKSPVP